MKSFVFILCWFFLLTQNFAQYCDLAAEETNPDVLNSDGNPDNDILDWRTPYYHVALLDQNGQIYETDIVSPFFTQSLSGASNPNVIHLDTEERDFEYSDGWELIQWDFGLSAAPGVPPLGVKYPFFVLYNRYESKLRYFFYTRDQLVGDIHALSIHFTNVDGTVHHVDASLEHVFTPSDPIDSYQDKGIKVVAPNEYRFNGQLWLMGEVLIAYDPCSCKYPSMYEFSNRLYTSQDFSLTLESDDGSSITQVFQNSEPVTNSDNGFSINKLAVAIRKGTKNSKSYASTIKEVEKLLLSTLNGNLMLKKRFKDEGLELPEGLTIDELKTWLAAGNDTSTPEGQKNAILKKFLKDKLLVKEIFPDWLKEIVPYAGFIGPLLELFSGGGKITPPMPMMFNIDLNYIGSGTIGDTIALQSNIVFTPGSYAGDKKTVPVYNEVLGVLSVVEEPTLLVAKKSFTEPFYVGNTNLQLEGQKVSFKLKGPVKYALNPASGLKIKDIQACFLLGEGIQDYSLGELAPEETFYTVLPSGVTSEEAHIPVAIRYGGDGKDHPFVYKTPYVPLECLEEYSFRTPSHVIGGGFSEPRLQITAVLEPVDNPGAKNVYFSSTYKVKLEDAPYSYSSTPANPFINVPWDTTVVDVYDVLNGEVMAWNKITITGDFVWNEQTKKIVNYGPHKTIVHNSSGGGLPWVEDVPLIPDLNDGEVFHGPITVFNRPDCGPKITPVDKAFLENICNNPARYNPEITLSLLPDNNTQGNANTTISKEAFIFPNPVDNTLRIFYPVKEEKNYLIIDIFDSIGRQVFEKRIGYALPGNQIFTIPVDNLRKGVYMVSITNRNKREVLKMVKR